MAGEGTNLWDCGGCGTQAIAAGLGFCPNCRKEREMPAVNRFGESTIFGQPNEKQRAAMASAIGISPPAPVVEEPRSDADPEVEKQAEAEAAKELVDAGFDPEDVEKVVGQAPGDKMVEPEEPDTADPTALATEKASQAKEAFSSGNKAGAIALLDQAILLDPSRSDKWTKLKDQVIGSGETW